jgi:hypothetical protein
MTRALILGPDRGLEAALSETGVESARIDGPASERTLEDAGLADTALLFVTDPAEASSIPVATAINPELRVVWYAPDSVPGFVTGQLDLGVDPAIAEPSVLVEEQLSALDTA